MKKTVITGLIVVFVIVIAASVLIFSNYSNSSSGIKNIPLDTGSGTSAGVEATNPEAGVKVINIDAQRFQFNPGSITVKRGDHVKIVIHNKDTTHGIMIPDYGVSGIEGVEFTADKVGTFEFRCPTMCGSGHRDMKGTLIVEE